MEVKNLEVKFQNLLDPKSTKIIVPVFKDKTEKIFPELFKWIQERIAQSDFSANSGETIYYYDQRQNYLILGMGDLKELNAIRVRSNLASAVRTMRNAKISQCSVFIPVALKSYMSEIAEGVVLGNYSLGLLQTGSNKKSNEEKLIKSLTVFGANFTVKEKAAFLRGKNIGQSVNYVRNLVNLPYNLVDTDYLANEAKKIGQRHRYRVTILDRPRLQKLGFGALLSVNDGSTQGAKVAVLEYFPVSRKQAPIALVGKGVTFDTGGLNLKPSSGIDWMKMDMAGAAVVLGVFNLLKVLNIKQNVVAVLPITDNSVDARSIKPNDIVTSFSGKTIEILNTDAEGRLILADAIAYAVKTFKPARLIDLATLTGACMVALGEQQAGLFSNDHKLVNDLETAAQETDEEVWELPIHEFHRKELNGRFSDLVNLGDTGFAGASIGAAFLENFVDKTPWAHLDIAGVAKCKKNKDINPAGSATGYGVRLLINFLENLKTQ